MLAMLHNAHPSPVDSDKLDIQAVRRLAMSERPLVQLETVSGAAHPRNPRSVASYRLTPHGVRCGQALAGAITIGHQVHITPPEGRTPGLDKAVRLW